MKLGGVRESGNVEDRRGMGFGRGGMAVGGGCGTVIVIILALIFGVDPSQFLSGGGAAAEGPPPAQRPGGAPGQPQQSDEDSRFIRKVLTTTEDVWNDIFRRNGSDYREPTLVLFTQQVQSACGVAGASVGPFYCPADEKVYIDLSFYDELQSRFRAPGDFAQAYVIAHEVGHHVQNLLGTSDKVTTPPAALAERGAVQRPLRPSGVTGRLLRGRVGLLLQAAEPPRPGRPRRGFERRLGHRRRPSPARVARPRRPRLLHTRLVRAAAALVPPRLRQRRHPPLRHLQHAQSVRQVGLKLATETQRHRV